MVGLGLCLFRRLLGEILPSFFPFGEMPWMTGVGYS